MTQAKRIGRDAGHRIRWIKVSGAARALPRTKGLFVDTASFAARILLLASLSSISGCLTLSYHDMVKDMDSPKNEYRTIGSKRPFVQGIATENYVWENEKYTRLQFPNALQGEGRLLEFLLPSDGEGKHILRETKSRIDGGSAAFLIFQGGVYDLPESERILDLGSGDTVSNPEELLASVFGVAVSPEEFPSMSSVSIRTATTIYSRATSDSASGKTAVRLCTRAPCTPSLQTMSTSSGKSAAPVSSSSAKWATRSSCCSTSPRLPSN